MAQNSSRNWRLIIGVAFILQLPLFFILLNLYQSVVSVRPMISRLQANLSSRIEGANLCNLIPDRDDTQQRLTPHGVAHYTFIDMSTYRASFTTFFVIGIASVVLRKAGPPVDRCVWHPNNATHDLSQPLTDTSLYKTTAANLMYIHDDEHGEPYATVIVNCTFQEEVGKDGYGGLLTLAVAVRGRSLKIVDVVVHREKRREVEEMMERIDHVPKYVYTFCGPPIFKCDRPDWFLQWITYHNYVFERKVHYFFYNVGGVTQEVRQLLDPFLREGLITIIEVEEQNKYLSWYYNQVLFINDCLHRSRYVAKWAFFHDLDEFLYVEPPQTLRGLLEEHKDKPWLTYGNVLASTRHCRSEEQRGEWPLERMLCTSSQPECKDKKQDPWKCLGGYGRRKYAAQTSKVMASGVHHIAVPSTQGLNLNASIARVYHYRGLLATVNPCSIPVDVSLPEAKLRKTVPGYKSCYRDNSAPLLLQRSKAVLSF